MPGHCSQQMHSAVVYQIITSSNNNFLSCSRLNKKIPFSFLEGSTSTNLASPHLVPQRRIQVFAGVNLNVLEALDGAHRARSWRPTWMFVPTWRRWGSWKQGLLHFLYIQWCGSSMYFWGSLQERIISSFAFKVFMCITLERDKTTWEGYH